MEKEIFTNTNICLNYGLCFALFKITQQILKRKERSWIKSLDFDEKVTQHKKKLRHMRHDIFGIC